MFTFFPIGAAVLQAGSFVLDKVMLRIRGARYEGVTGAMFALSFFILFVLFAFFQPPISGKFFEGALLTALLLNIAINTGSSIFYYRALSKDDLSEVQTIDLLYRFPLIALAGLLFADERQPIVILTATISALAILWSHHHGRKLRMNRNTTAYLFWTVAVAPFAGVMSKLLLAFWHPLSLEFVRGGLLALVLTPFVLKEEKKLPPRVALFALFSSLCSAVAMVLFFWSVKNSGLIYTMQIFALQPFLVYLGSLLFLKEKFHVKKTIAFGVVLVSVVVTELARGVL